MSKFDENTKYNLPGKAHLSCMSCGKVLLRENENFYKSNNSEYDNIGTYAPYCKQCCKLMAITDDGNINKTGFLKLLKILNRPYMSDLVDNVIDAKSGFDLGEYLKRVAFVKNYKKLGFLDSDVNIDKFSYDLDKNKGTPNPEEKNESQEIKLKEENIKNIDDSVQIITPIIISDDDLKNQKDCIRLLGYDPFIADSDEDRRFLFNKLIDFLDEDTLADNFKCLTVIEIVQLFKQAELMNKAISQLKVTDIATNPGVMKAFIDTKNKLLNSALSLAKDNGISVNHNNNKSKGGNTLSGINKKIQEIGLESAELNLYDIETSKAMKQIADISNKSILDTLMLDENDYMVMLAEQRDTIVKLTEKANKFEEEARLLRKELNIMIAEKEEQKYIE